MNVVRHFLKVNSIEKTVELPKLRCNPGLRVLCRRRFGVPPEVENEQETEESNIPPGSFYRRALKPPAIDMESEEGEELLKEAMAAGGAKGIVKLLGSYKMQQELTFGGLASLSVVLNTLGIDPGQVWKCE